MPDSAGPSLRPGDESDLALMQSILSDGLARGGDRYYAHPGDIGWWMYHWDERRPLSWWIHDEDAFVVIDPSSDGEINVFGRPGVDLIPLIRWARTRLQGRGEVAWVSDSDHELVQSLTDLGSRPAFTFRNYRWDLTRSDIPEANLGEGWELRHLQGEDEADNRRAASHAAFGSSMPADMHLQRYLKFMRAPVYDPERDLVAVAPDGRIASFMVWWPDTSGIAQIEPFGTHPEFQRQGIGRSLIYHGLAKMREAGMHTARVCTDEPRPATRFYTSVGFEEVGRLS